MTWKNVGFITGSLALAGLVLARVEAHSRSSGRERRRRATARRGGELTPASLSEDADLPLPARPPFGERDDDEPAVTVHMTEDIVASDEDYDSVDTERMGADWLARATEAPRVPDAPGERVERVEPAPPTSSPDEPAKR